MKAPSSSPDQGGIEKAGLFDRAVRAVIDFARNSVKTLYTAGALGLAGCGMIPDESTGEGHGSQEDTWEDAGAWKEDTQTPFGADWGCPVCPEGRDAECPEPLDAGACPVCPGQGDTVPGPGGDTVPGPGGDTVPGPGGDTVPGPGEDTGAEEDTGPEEDTGAEEDTGPGGDTGPEEDTGAEGDTGEKEDIGAGEDTCEEGDTVPGQGDAEAGPCPQITVEVVVEGDGKASFTPASATTEGDTFNFEQSTKIETEKVDCGGPNGEETGTFKLTACNGSIEVTGGPGCLDCNTSAGIDTLGGVVVGAFLLCEGDPAHSITLGNDFDGDPSTCGPKENKEPEEVICEVIENPYND